MKKKIIFSLIAILFLVFIDWIFYLFNWFGNNSKISDISYLFLFSIIILTILLNFSYRKLFDFNSPVIKVLFFFFVFLFFAFFASQRVLVINKLYFFTKTYKQDEKGKLWQTDDILSYKGKPNFEGTQNYFIGDSIQGEIATYFDSLGFRNTSKDKRLPFDTLNLFLGCSFTFGSYIKAEDTYAHKISNLIHNNYINAGGSGYGIGQMLILLDSLIKNNNFKYVFIQLSPWLVDRAMQINAPFYYFYRPIPYFSESGNSFKLNRPAYKNTSITFGRNWNKTNPNYFEKICFFFVDGLKIELCDYIKQKTAKIKIAMGVLPKPTKKRDELEKFAYQCVIDLCKQKGAIPVVLKLAYPDKQAEQIIEYLKQKCIFIDLDEDLNNEVKLSGKSYYELYSISHNCNGKQIIFDTHPNAFANDIIANKIYKTLTNK